MLPDILPRLSSHRASCKQWSAGLGVVILLMGALARLSPENLLWAAAPILFLGLAEAGYAAQERRYLELSKNKTGNDEASSWSLEPASASVVRMVFAVMSLSIWPFYLGLFATVAIGGTQMAAANKPVLLARNALATQPGIVRPVSGAPSCGAGGCGTSGGCGNGGCGAGSGKGCSCGGETKLAASERPGQRYIQTANGPMAIPNGPVAMPNGRAMQQGMNLPQQGPVQRLPNGAIISAQVPPNSANPGQVRNPVNSFPPGAAAPPMGGPNVGPPPAHVPMVGRPPASSLPDGSGPVAIPAPAAGPTITGPAPANSKSNGSPPGSAGQNQSLAK